MEIGNPIKNLKQQILVAPIRDLISKQITSKLNSNTWSLISSHVFSSMWTMTNTKL